MDHQKQIRDSLEKHNQLVLIHLFRFFPDPIPNIRSALSAKSTSKTTTVILSLNNTGTGLALAPTMFISRTYVTSMLICGTGARIKLINRLKGWQLLRRKGDKGWLKVLRKMIVILWPIV